MAHRKPYTPATQKPSTALEIAAAKKAHQEIRQAGFTPTEENTFVMDDKVWARSLESIPGTGGHPVESRVLPVKRTPKKKGKPNREPVDNFSVRVQQTSGSWKTVQSGMRQAEAKKEAQRLAHDYWYAAVFKGRKKHWSPKE